MTAGRERSAGRASLSVAARDRVSLRAGGEAHGSDRDFTPTYPGVENLGPVERVLAAMVDDAVRWDRAQANRRAKLTVVERAS